MWKQWRSDDLCDFKKKTVIINKPSCKKIWYSGKTVKILTRTVRFILSALSMLLSRLNSKRASMNGYKISVCKIECYNPFYSCFIIGCIANTTGLTPLQLWNMMTYFSQLRQDLLFKVFHSHRGDVSQFHEHLMRARGLLCCFHIVQHPEQLV